ncbi:hypothetical protein ROA7450_04042 [Roseovarius albus]|uniref:DUF3576 domain-containing protein n=1 Tax=Roseovarius albus TaxID=1247867 RepID=A0A1X7A7M6_9RHOB|nr:DUF3576 domain-containing protein [Roseovarius albus]SLN72554.1 hypothetical protein ROA7450_04042 [Roseovarius albus]
MILSRLYRLVSVFLVVALVASCSAWTENATFDPETTKVKGGRESNPVQSGTSLFEAFQGDPTADVKVNRFLWTASLEVLSFLPVQDADPFTGVINTGYGTPPGGGTSYRATVLISDPALDARSLNVALQTKRGPVSAATQRAVEDAILARARQLRIQAAKF